MRHGTSLVELLVALVLVGILAAAGGLLAARAGRHVLQAQAELAAARDGAAITGLVLHDLALQHRADLALPATTTLEYDRPVLEATGCGIAAGMPIIRLATVLARRGADPSRDAALVLTRAVPARWEARRLLATATSACDDGGRGVLLTLDTAVDSALVVRVREPVRLRHYLSGGRGWLGLEPRRGPGTIQPFAGPLPSSDLTLQLVGGTLVFGTVPGAVFTQPVE